MNGGGTDHILTLYGELVASQMTFLHESYLKLVPMPSRGKLMKGFGWLVCLMFLLKVRRGEHHAGILGGDCKKRERAVCWDERSSDVWDWDGRHIEGYLSGFMYKFVYMVYVQRSFLDCIVLFVVSHQVGFTSHIL